MKAEQDSGRRDRGKGNGHVQSPNAPSREWQLAVPCVCGLRNLRVGGRTVRPGRLPRALCVSPGSLAFLWYTVDVRTRGWVL